MEKQIIKALIAMHGHGFSTGQLKKLEKALFKVIDRLSGKATSMGSGGNFYHIFFQLEDNTWIGFHNGTNDFTISKPYKSDKKLYDAFWDDDQGKVFVPYKPQ